MQSTSACSSHFVRGFMLLIIGLFLTASTVALPGCVGYAVYPPEEGVRGFRNPNSDPLPTLMAEAVRWVSLRYPCNAQAEWSAPPSVMLGEAPKFAVNLPAGVNRSVYLATVRKVGPNAMAMEPGLEGLPTYHVAKIYVTGDQAKVEVLRPIPSSGGNKKGDAQLHQGITVRLRGGVQPWHVTSHTVWTIGVMETPPISYVPQK